MLANAVLFYTLLFRMSVSLEVAFYEDKNQTGWIQTESKVANCRNLRVGGGQATSVDTHGQCAILYSKPDCEGQFMKIFGNKRVNNDLSEWNFHKKTRSISPCNSTMYLSSSVWLYPGVSDILNTFKNPYITAPLDDLCNCHNLPVYTRKNISLVLTTGVCVLLFAGEECSGDFIELKPGERGNFYSWTEDTLSMVSHFKNITVSSVRACGTRRKSCPRLTPSVYRIDWLTDLSEWETSSAIQEVDFMARTTIENNSSQIVTETIKYKRDYTEETTMEQITGSSSVFEWFVEEEFKLSVDFELFKLGSKAEAGIKGHQGGDETTSSQNTTRNTTRTTKTYSVDKSVPVGPCKRVEVGSSIQVLNNMLVDFELSMKLKGTLGQRKLNAAELYDVARDIGMVPHAVLDNFTIIAKTNGSMTVSVGLKLNWRIDEENMEPCGSYPMQPPSLLAIFLAAQLAAVYFCVCRFD